MTISAPVGTRSTRRRLPLGSIAAYAILGAWAIFTLFPIVWVYTSAVKTPEQIFEVPPKWIFRPTLHNFEVVLGLTIPTELETVTTEAAGGIQSKFPRYLLNSVIVAVGSTALSLVLGSLAAYSLARFRLRGRETIMTGLILTRLVPPVTLVIPLYLLWRNLHLLDTYQGLILVDLTFNLPFTIWIMRGFFLDIPVELEEASLVDGSSRFGAFGRIALPLVAPGLATTAIFGVLFSWNEFLFASVLTTEHARTITPSISGYITDKAILWGRLYAAAALILLPVMVFALLAQRHLGRGVTSGALKG